MPRQWFRGFLQALLRGTPESAAPGTPEAPDHGSLCMSDKIGTWFGRTWSRTDNEFQSWLYHQLVLWSGI